MLYNLNVIKHGELILDKGQLVIYQSEDGSIKLDTRLEEESVWLTQQMMSELFDTTVPNINMHIKNIYQENELDEKATIKDFLIVRKEGKRTVSREIAHYNLDVIISVGYRIKSKIATKFRIWATNTLKEYLIKGYAINEQLLKEKQENLEVLKSAIAIVERGMQNQIQDLTQAKQLSALLSDFAGGLDLLDDYDHKTLDTKGKTEKEVQKVSTEEFLNVIHNMKSKFSSDVFALQKDESFDSSANQIYQTYGGKDCYPSLEEKAAMLLYFVVKNHSFTDGNKRIAASCFVYFLNKNNMLYNTNGNKVLSNDALFALTLLIAESKPEEMETVKQVIISVLNRTI